MMKMFQALRPGRGCTKFIACSNSNGLEKFMADDVLTGTADHVKINAMLTLMGPGILMIGAGTVVPSGTINYTANGQYIRGSGVTATAFNVPNSSGLNAGLFACATTECGLANLSIDGNKANNAANTGFTAFSVSTENFRMENVVSKNSPGNGGNVSAGAYNFQMFNSEVSLSAFVGLVVSTNTTTNKVSALIEGCRFDQNQSTAGLYLAGQGIRVVGCAAASNNGSGIASIAGTSANTIIGCEANVNITNGIDLAGDDCLATGCTLIGNGVYGAQLVGVGNSFVGNTVHANASGVRLAGNSQNCSGNMFYKNTIWGILVECQDGAVLNNYCYQNGTAANNTYPQIYISSLGDNCNVQGNTCRKGATGNLPAYGINLLAGATNNLVANNDLYDSGVSAAIFDSGTNTRYGIRYQGTVAAGDTINTTAAETNFATNFPIPAGVLNSVGKVFRIRAWGTYGTLGSGTVTLQLKLKFGTTTVIDFGSITTAISISGRVWRIDADATLVSLGGSGTLEVAGEARIPTANDNVTASRPANLSGPATIDTTAAQTVQISAQHGASSVSNTITMRQFTLELVN